MNLREQEGNGILLSGQVTTDEKRKITGSFTVSDIDTGSTLEQGNLTGKVDKKVSKLSFKFQNGVNGKAARLPETDPQMPLSWTAKAGKGGVFPSVTIQQITQDDEHPELSYPHRVYSIVGEGVQSDGDLIHLEGGFFLNSKSMAYGWWTVQNMTEPIVSNGFMFGKVNLTPGKSSFSFKVTGYDSTDGLIKAVLKGKAQ